MIDSSCRKELPVCWALGVSHAPTRGEDVLLLLTSQGRRTVLPRWLRNSIPESLTLSKWMVNTPFLKEQWQSSLNSREFSKRMRKNKHSIWSLRNRLKLGRNLLYYMLSDMCSSFIRILRCLRRKLCMHLSANYRLFIPVPFTLFPQQRR